MDTAIPALTAITGIIIAIITGFISYRTARWNLRRDMELELRRQRLDALRKLWAISEPLAKYGLPESEATATVTSMKQLAASLRSWYFHEGGMFLSEDSREAYTHFQDAIRKAIADTPGGSDQLDDTTREAARIAGSALRATLRKSFKGFPTM